MSGSMFSVGRDCQVVVLGAYGRVDLAHVTGFEGRQLTASVRVDRIDGVQLGAELPKGWEGTFELERGNSAADALAEAEAMARALAEGPTAALGGTRALLVSSLTTGLEEKMKLEAAPIAVALRGEGQEGIAAFLSKRKPDFRKVCIEPAHHKQGSRRHGL